MTIRELWEFAVENGVEDYALHDIEYGYVELEDLSISKTTKTINM